jgi:quinol monooxygenase YgiN
VKRISIRRRRGAIMARFVQIIEFQSSRIEEIEQLGRPSRTEGTTAPTFGRIMATADRDRPGTYLTIVEFDSYESAMENSNRPETSEFAAKMAALCDGPPVFRNLDVMWEDSGEADAGE